MVIYLNKSIDFQTINPDYQSQPPLYVPDVQFDLFRFTCVYLLLVHTGRDLVLRLLSLHLGKKS